MTEQEQAQALSRWLEQPAGTPPPEGLDPEVVESVYAMRPDLAPELTLGADDILAGFDFGSAIAPEIGDESPGVVTLSDGGAPMPQTPVKEAPKPLFSANRVAGLGVLMATAATLLLVALPAIQSDLSRMEPGAVQSEEVAAMPSAPSSARQADPIASVADEEGEGWAEAEADEPVQIADAKQQANTELPVEDLALEVEGDAVADAGDLDQADGYDKNMEYAPEQRARMTGEDTLIPEVQAGLAKDGASDDAVVALDEDLELAEEEFAAPATAPPMEAVPSADYGYEGGAYEDVDSVESKKSRPSKRNQKKDRADQSGADLQTAAAAEEVAQSSRDQANPDDYDPSFWRATTDAATAAEVDKALTAARAEAQLGNHAKAGEIMSAMVKPPSDAGAFAAIEAAQYLLQAGDTRGALTIAQRGLGFTSGDSAVRSKLYTLYGLALDAGGNSAEAEVQYEEASRLNRSRGR